MIFDTDVLIWAQRGNNKAADAINTEHSRCLSVQSYMELLQGAHNKTQHQYIKTFLSDFNFTVLPLTEDIGHLAAMYIEKYSLSSGIRTGDAIIAATATENNQPLLSGNVKHFKMVRELDLQTFQP